MTETENEIKIESFGDIEPRLFQNPWTSNIVIDLGEDYAYVKIFSPAMKMLFGSEVPVPVEYGKLYPWRRIRNRGTKYTGPVDSTMRAEIARWA